jgi:selenocysteine lyase/cysteine desulfurase
LSLRFRGLDTDEAAGLLSERGICLRSGLHCAPLAHRTAGTLETGTLRMSFSPFVTAGELSMACAAIRELSG